MKWVRAKDGAIFGVCKGLARTLDIPVGLFRLLWLISILFLGTGLALYLLLAIALPREDKVVQALNPRLLGVCAKVALRTDVEVGIIRFLALCLMFLSLGATLVGYVVLYFILDNKKSQSSDNKPSTPPLTT
ncbi:MAG: PspC domain-containing protein [Bdellovibrionales bacterium]|nr:PspC domain-containing protein [Bdellovibrionales bacterium]